MWNFSFMPLNADKVFVIVFGVILSGAKNLVFPWRVSSTKNLTLKQTT